MPDYQCEICGVVGPQETMYVGWSVTCANNPDCQAPLTHPKVRAVAALTVETLDELESAADAHEERCEPADVPPDVLRALLDVARRHLADVERGKSQRAALEAVAGPLRDDDSALPDDLHPWPVSARDAARSSELIEALKAIVRSIGPSFLGRPMTPSLHVAMENAATESLWGRLSWTRGLIRVTSEYDYATHHMSFDLAGTTADGMDTVFAARRWVRGGANVEDGGGER